MKFSNTLKMTPAWRAAAIISSAWATLSAMGFCTEMCLPAAAASSVAWWCRWCGSRISDQVHLRHGQEVVIVGEDAIGGDAPGLAPPLGIFGDGVGHGHDLRAGIGQVLQRVEVGYAACADDAYS